MVKYTIEEIKKISNSIDKNIQFVSDDYIDKMRKIYNEVNIKHKSKENVSATVIEKKKDSIGDICVLLNKITEQTYDKISVNIIDCIQNLNLDEMNNIHNLCHYIFKIASNTKIFSHLYAKLYIELIKINEEFNVVFNQYTETYLDNFYKCEFADPNTNYDDYCVYVKEINNSQALLLFFINMMKSCMCPTDFIVKLCLEFQKKLISNIDNEACADENTSIQENIYIIISECLDFLVFNEKWDDILEKIHFITGKKTKGINGKIRFKNMDILDIINK